MADETHAYRKPIRLGEGFYAVPGWICSITVCTTNRAPAFSYSALARSCLDLLRSRAEATGIQIHAYCFMPDHLHLLASVSPSTSLLDFVRDYKSRSTRLAWQHGIRGALWQERYYDHFLRKDEDVQVAVEYILSNPVRKGLVAEPKGYPYCGSFVYELWTD